MDTLFYVVGTLWASYFHAIVIVATLVFAFCVMTHRWSALAREFPAMPGSVPAAGIRDWAIFNSAFRARPLVVPATFALAPDGVYVSTVQPLSWALGPIFLPFDHMRIVPVEYARDHDAWAIRMVAHEVSELVLTGDLRKTLVPQLRAAGHLGTHGQLA